MKLLSIILLSAVFTTYAAPNVEICAHQTSRADISHAVKWYRDSAEKKALYNQAYFLGAEYVKAWVKFHHAKVNTWGVILDVDETVLDNSWYLRECGDTILNEADFSHYVANAKKSVALPGVVKFTNLVHKLGGYVSIVTNRDGTFKDDSGGVMDATIANLIDQKVYFDQVILANRRDSKTPTDKNPRFEAVISGKYNSTQMVWSKLLPAHKVIAYFGDNIQDFPKLQQETINAMDGDSEIFKQFGNGYFILPNPMYGSWQKNVYK
jgi:5'-nucleotidase (lipoprotein e(P4) family)